MKYLWGVQIEGRFGSYTRFTVTDNDDPSEAIEIAKKHFTKKGDGTKRRILAVTFSGTVYTN